MVRAGLSMDRISRFGSVNAWAIDKEFVRLLYWRQEEMTAGAITTGATIMAWASITADGEIIIGEHKPDIKMGKPPPRRQTKPESTEVMGTGVDTRDDG